MSIVNGYLTLAEYKRSANIDDSTDSDATDDLVIEALIEEASRFMDDETCRTFYPRVETRYHDTPPEGRELWVDDDLLEVLSITNGDDSTVADSDYNLVPKNSSPHYAIKLIMSSSETWDLDSSGNSESVIDVNAIWGYHTNYTQRAWSTGSTVSDSDTISASSTTVGVAALTNFDPGQLIRIDDEIARITATATTTDSDSNSSYDLTLVRGENGSTAAAHDDSSAIYVWNVHPPVQSAVRAIVQNEYKRRYGETTAATATVTGAGVVLAPDSIPASAARIIRNLKRVT